MTTEILKTSQVTIWWAGLMRGAVSMALAYNKVKISFHVLPCASQMVLAHN